MIKVISFGEKDTPEINEYLKRISLFKIQTINHTNTKELKSIPFEKCVVLDAMGDQMTSEEFAKFVASRGDISFVIGPHDGMPDMYKQKAMRLFSLSKMTFPHMVARMLLIEQIYRAQQIVQNHPYHK